MSMNCCHGISEEAVKAAWLALNPRGAQTLETREVRQLLQLAYPKLDPAQLKQLARPLDLPGLQHLLQQDVPQDLNPMLEAFRILDPNGTGSADLSRMRAMMDRLWPQDKVTDEDLQAIMVLLDADRDGAISCADFAAVNTSCSSVDAGSSASSRAQGTLGVAQLSKGN